mgnify:CR=1 FL=1
MAKKKEKKKDKKKTRNWLVVLGVILILVNAFTIYNILLLGPIEEVLRFIIIGVLVLIDLIFLFKIKSKKKHKEKKVRLLTTFMILYLIINILVSVAIMWVYGSIDGINKTFVTYSSSLVTMADSQLETIDDVEEIRIGMISDENSPDGYIIPNQIIDENDLRDKNNEFVSYDDYSSMLADLYASEIDAMFIATDYPLMFNSIEAYAHIADETKIIITKEKKMLKAKTSKRETASTGKSVKEPFTILLMGVDSTTDGLSKNTVANGDSLILITFNPTTLNATMLSIPRDSYVPIACWANKAENKITHAAAYGTDCMMQTIEDYFDVTIDYYAKINFRGLVSLVDALGGIEVDVPQDLCTDNSNREGQVCISAGHQVLNGEQALVLARNRKQLAAGDLDRGLNQQIVVQGIVNKVKDMSSIDQVMNVLNTISNNLDTNFTTEQILSFYDIAKDIMNHALQKDDADLINVQQLYLQGTGQMIYDERSRLVLWDYVPNTASRDDIISAMKVNLGLEEPEMEKEFSFSINEVYEKEVIGAGPYRTAFTYDLLPSFIGDTEAQARSWASRNGVNVVFNGSGGTVISQSYPASKRIDLISGAVTLTLSGGGSSTTTPTEPSTTPPAQKDQNSPSEGGNTDNSNNDNSNTGDNNSDSSGSSDNEPTPPDSEDDNSTDGNQPQDVSDATTVPDK